METIEDIKNKYRKERTKLNQKRQKLEQRTKLYYKAGILLSLLSLAVMFVGFIIFSAKIWLVYPSFLLIIGIVLIIVAPILRYGSTSDYDRKENILKVRAMLDWHKNKENTVVPIPELAEDTGLEPNRVAKLVRLLVEKGYYAGYIDEDTWEFAFGSRTPPKENAPQKQNNCPNCGRPIQPDWKMCPHCNADLE